MEKTTKGLTRRDFLRMSALTAAGMALAGCVPQVTQKQEVTVVVVGSDDGEGEQKQVPVRDSVGEQLIEGDDQQEEAVVSGGGEGQEESFWGPAGKAPQTREEAAKLLGVPETALTELNPAAGDPTVIGWVVGEAPYEKSFIPLLPAGVCVDYARSSGELTGTTEWLVEYPDVDWNRALMAGTGKIEANKATLYWTQCSKE